MVQRWERDLGDAPLVSVIVPVYKVEAYIRESVDSILEQSYKKLEIILVDDGSPDGCPAICDTYAALDPRVRVIHKVNGGLSDARNTGLDAARGELIGFVDPDDRIDSAMFELLVAAMHETGMQIAGCGYREFDEQAQGKEHGVMEDTVLDAHAALCLLARDEELQNYVWNKLFDSSLWQEVRFPVGQKYEDVSTTYKLVGRSNGVALIAKPLYGYRLRSDGIVGSRSFAAELDCTRANLERCEALAPICPEVTDSLVDGVLKAAVNLWPMVWVARGEFDEGQDEELRAISKFVKQHAKDSALSSRLGITGRLTLRLCAHAKPWAWYVAQWANRLYEYKHERRCVSGAPTKTPRPQLSTVFPPQRKES